MHQPSTLVDHLRAALGFEREPMNLDDGGLAFIGFVRFACGDSDVAHALQACWFNASGNAPRHDTPATSAECGQYIDWLIQTQWGEAGVTASTVH